MNNKRRLFSTLLCVAALTAGLFVSGCGSDKAGGIGSVVSSVVEMAVAMRKQLLSLIPLLMQQIASMVTMLLGVKTMQTVWLN